MTGTQINKDFRKRVSKELCRLRELWLEMRREGLGIESDDGTRSPEEEFLIAQAEWAFELFTRKHLTEVMGTTEHYKAMIISHFPEFPDDDDEDE